MPSRMDQLVARQRSTEGHEERWTKSRSWIWRLAAKRLVQGRKGPGLRRTSQETSHKKNNVFFFVWRSSMDPKRWFVMARFFDLPKIRLEMPGIGTEGRASQLQCAILAVQPCSLHSGPSRRPTLGRAVAAQKAKRAPRPDADPRLNPPRVNSSQKRPHPNPIKKRATNDL